MATLSLRGLRVPIVRALALFALLGGVLSLVGWAADIPALTDWEGAGISIQPNAAVAVMAAALAVMLHTLGFRRVVMVLGAAVALIGAASLLQYVTGVSLRGFNTLLMFDRTWGRGGVVDPGRMGPPGATCWIMIGAALVILAAGRARWQRLVPPMMLATAAIAFLAIVGYVYSAHILYTEPRLTVIAMQTALFILVISIAVLFSMTQHGPMRLLRDAGPAGLVARAAMPAIVVVAFVIGILRLEGERAGLFDDVTGTALRTVVEIVLLMGLLWWGLTIVRRHDRAMAQNRRRKDEFLAVLAHELRGPLAPLRNSVELIKRVGGEGNGILRQARDVMDRQITHLVRLVDDLVDVSRMTHDKLQLRARRTELAPVLVQAIDATRARAEAADVHIEVTLPPEPIVLDADPVRLAQIFGNILHNACKYNVPGGTVRVAAERRGAHVVIRVRDSGIGIPRDRLAAVFDMFTQVESASRPLGGLGVGLALVKRLVEMHGGTVTAHSEGAGTGAELIVTLPVAAVETVDQRQSGGRPPVDASGHRVLIVDDNVDAAESLALLLSHGGFETHTAYDGLAAVEAAERLRPDVMLLDLGLPSIDGLEACRRIRARPWGADVLMIAVTGLGQDDDRRKSREAGFDRHLVKPVNYEGLRRILAEWKAPARPA